MGAGARRRLIRAACRATQPADSGAIAMDSVTRPERVLPLPESGERVGVRGCFVGFASRRPPLTQPRFANARRKRRAFRQESEGLWPSDATSRPKSDVSDFGQFNGRPKSGKPDFGCKRGEVTRSA